MRLRRPVAALVVLGTRPALVQPVAIIGVGLSPLGAAVGATFFLLAADSVARVRIPLQLFLSFFMFLNFYKQHILRYFLQSRKTRQQGGAFVPLFFII